MVVTERGEAPYPKEVIVDTVAPFTERTFHIHSGLRIISIIEQVREHGK